MNSAEHTHLITPAVLKAWRWLEDDRLHGRDKVEDLIEQLCTVHITPTPPEVIAACRSDNGEEYDARIELLRARLTRLDELEGQYEEAYQLWGRGQLRAQLLAQRDASEPSRCLAAACHISAALVRAWRAHQQRCLKNIVNMRIDQARKTRSLQLATLWIECLVQLHRRLYLPSTLRTLAANELLDQVPGIQQHLACAALAHIMRAKVNNPFALPEISVDIAHDVIADLRHTAPPLFKIDAQLATRHLCKLELASRARRRLRRCSAGSSLGGDDGSSDDDDDDCGGGGGGGGNPRTYERQLATAAERKQCGHRC